MIPFEIRCVTRLLSGADRIDSVGDLAGELGARRVLVVSDPGVMAAGHARRGNEALRRSGMTTELFGDVQENPSTHDVNRGLEVARDFRPELLVGLGGGSAMDCAKGINFLFTNGGQLQDYCGIGKARRPMLPMIAVPTTAGTGSEMQSFALISDAETKTKMACGDEKAFFRVAILDPRLTVTQPQRVTALAGIDAIAHAVETYVTRRRNPASLLFSREAWRLLVGNFRKVLERSDDLDARGGMQLGASLAGWAIEHAMLGAAHALANPLTAAYGIAHGQAVGLMLPHVVRFNGEAFPEWYTELLAAAGGIPGCPQACEGVAGLARFLASLLEYAGLATRLSQLGVQRERITELAAAAARQWTGTFNPRQVGPQELEELYSLAL